MGLEKVRYNDSCILHTLDILYMISKIPKAMTEKIRCRTPFRELEVGVNLTGNYIERSS